MAEYYVSSLAVGGGDGTQGNPWTLAEAVAAINADDPWDDGDTLYIKNDGKYTTAGISITNAGTATAYNNIIGYTSVITDDGRPEIERSGGTGVLVDINVNYWKVKNIEIDGQDAGTINIRLLNYCFLENADTHHAGTVGVSSPQAAMAINCYSHDNGAEGFYYTSTFGCISKNNTIGIFRPIMIMDSVIIDCRSTTQSVDLYASAAMINSIVYGGAGAGVTISSYPGLGVINCIFMNTPVGKYAIQTNNFIGNYKNNNFYGIGGTISDRMDFLGIYYELDPQFSNSDNLDFRRIGRNLEDKGFSQVGLQSFNYKKDIGIDQETQVDYPSESDVREGVSYFFGTKEGLLDLPSEFYVKKGIKYDQETKIGTYALASGLSYAVKLNFNDGTHDYDFPLIQAISDPFPAMKATVIEGARGSGAVIIPGGQKSIEIVVRGILMGGDYQQINDLINEMRTNVTTLPAILTLKFWTGIAWENSWQYAVERIDEIEFSDSYRINDQEYTARFLVFAY